MTNDTRLTPPPSSSSNSPFRKVSKIPCFPAEAANKTSVFKYDVYVAPSGAVYEYSTNILNPFVNVVGTATQCDEVCFLRHRRDREYQESIALVKVMGVTLQRSYDTDENQGSTTYAIPLVDKKATK